VYAPEQPFLPSFSAACLSNELPCHTSYNNKVVVEKGCRRRN
jgi:hypothetical protein